jgi:hypothetical protein
MSASQLPAARVVKAPAAAPEKLSDKLFRFFDFTVEPGKRYRYRVQLALENPNFNVPDFFLTPAATKMRTKEFRPTAWSEPTPVVAIPYGNDVLAGAVQPNGFEPTANLKLVAMDPEEGLRGTTELKAMRGRLLNLKESVAVFDPRSNQTKMVDLDFHTDAILLDMRGGKQLDKEKTLTEPGELLLLDRNHNLVVRHELDDAEQRRQPAVEKSAVQPKLPNPGLAPPPKSKSGKKTGHIDGILGPLPGDSTPPKTTSKAKKR